MSNKFCDRINFKGRLTALSQQNWDEFFVRRKYNIKFYSDGPKQIMKYCGGIINMQDTVLKFNLL